MPFEKNNKLGHKFSSTNQPANRGRKPKAREIANLLHRHGGRWTREEVNDYLAVILQSGEDELNALQSDPDTPILLKSYITGLMGENSVKVADSLLDRLFGKPSQQADITSNGKDAMRMHPFSMRIIESTDEIIHTVFDPYG